MQTRLRRQFLKRMVVLLAIPSFFSACGGDSGAPSALITTPKLSSVSNFRDIAMGDQNTTYRTSGGQHLRQGLLYRSNALTLSTEDLATLDMLTIRAVYDLRTSREVDAQPDVLPDGAVYRHIDIIGDAHDALPLSVSSPAEAIAFIEDLNRQFVTDANQRARFTELFRAIAASNDIQLFHCTAGKDRTGWAAAVLLTLAGVIAKKNHKPIWLISDGGHKGVPTLRILCLARFIEKLPAIIGTKYPPDQLLKTS